MFGHYLERLVRRQRTWESFGLQPRTSSNILARMTGAVADLIGRQCTRVTMDLFDPPVVLWFLYEGPVARVEISFPFEVKTNGLIERVVPDGDRIALAPLLSFIGKRVTRAYVIDPEGLRLEFDDSSTISIPGDPAHENWHFDTDEDVPQT